MNDQSENQDQQPQPVAYDRSGRPLYAAPPEYSSPSAQFVHLSRATDPVKPQLSKEQQEKHAQSTKTFPQLNLSDAEYVISVVEKHSKGMAPPVAVTALMLLIIALLVFNYSFLTSTLGIIGTPGFGIVALIGGLVSILVIAGGYMAIWVYVNNKFYLTNESVIQEIQDSMLSKREQTVSLANIEDASYTQRGLLQSAFNCGSIRLSTQGDETTYRFSYVSQPKKQIAILNNAVEAFKNGRPIEKYR